MREVDIIFNKKIKGMILGTMLVFSSILQGCSQEKDTVPSQNVADADSQQTADTDSQQTAGADSKQEQTGEEKRKEDSSKTDEKMETDMKKSYTVEEAAYESFSSFIEEYYFKSKITGYGIFLDANSAQLHFWDQAEIYEVVIDAYERTGDQRYYDMILEIFDGFKRLQGEDWAWNEYNDDIMWMTIACTRAYNCTGDQAFLDIAKSHFDMVWDRAWSEDMGGGLWWRTDNNSKNACVNCPGAIAACLLGEALDDESYYDKAKMIMDWMVDTLYYDGYIWDNLDVNGQKYDWNFTYNQGTFIGACTLLYLHTGDGAYLSQARRAADHTIQNMYNYGVMNNENSGGDLIGFKGILARWMYAFAVNCNQPDVMEWLKENAMVAWSNRNSKGIIQTTWGTKTKDKDVVPAFSASTAVSVLNNCKENCKTSLMATDDNSAKEFTRCGKLLVTENDKDGLSMDILSKNAFLEYAYVRFTKDSSNITVTAGAEKEVKLEVRLDAPDGELVASATVPAGTIETPKEISMELSRSLSGKQRVYLVFPDGEAKVLVSGFRFEAK